MAPRKEFAKINPAACMDLRSAIILAVNKAYNEDEIRKKTKDLAIHFAQFPEFPKLFVALCEMKDAADVDAGLKDKATARAKFGDRAGKRIGLSLFELVSARTAEIVAAVKTMDKLQGVSNSSES